MSYCPFHAMRQFATLEDLEKPSSTNGNFNDIYVRHDMDGSSGICLKGPRDQSIFLEAADKMILNRISFWNIDNTAVLTLQTLVIV